MPTMAETVRDAQATLGTIGEARAACGGHVRPPQTMRVRDGRFLLTHLYRECTYDSHNDLAVYVSKQGCPLIISAQRHLYPLLCFQGLSRGEDK